MDPNSIKTMAAAAGAASGDKVYVEDVFSTDLYSGTGTENPINNGIDLAGEGGMVWIKSRSSPSVGHFHHLVDSERAKIDGFRPAIYSNSTDVQNEYTASTNGGVSSLNSNGFTLDEGSSSTWLNLSGHTFAAWTFRKAKGFFDVVTYTGDDESSREISHSLGSVPGFITVKALNTDTCTTNPGTWRTYHKSVGATKYLRLDTNNLSDTRPEVWDDTSPTSSVFTVGIDNNQNNVNYVAYIFASGVDAACKIFGDDENQEIISCGAFASNGSSHGTKVLGWEPQWIIGKCYDSGDDWYMLDAMRNFGVQGVDNRRLRADSNTSEADYPHIYVTNDGFGWNGSAIGPTNWVFVAIRRGLMKTPEDATKVFAVDYGNGSTNIPNFDSGFPVDWGISKVYGSTDDHECMTRLTGDKKLILNSTASQADGGSNWVSDSNVGWAKTDYSTTRVSWMFQRAPGFFDIVCYEGTGSARTLDHNLGVVPELVIVKNREGNYAWSVYVSHLSSPRANKLLLNNEPVDDTVGAGTHWGNSDFTSTQISLGSYSETNQTGAKDMIAYLFASCPGVSKIGTYTGTGNNLDIDDCGFSGSARFVLIKRTNEVAGGVSGDWYLWDSLRGINSSANDPYTLLNNDDDQVTDEDRIEPLTGGFKLTNFSGTNASHVNASGGEYIYLAIA